MRRFRLKKGAVTDGFLKPVKHGVVYYQDYFLNKGGNLIQEGIFWQEVFEPQPKPLHKDTDLGAFSAMFVASLINDPASLKMQTEHSCEYRAKWAIAQARELIKQLDEQGNEQSKQD